MPQFSCFVKIDCPYCPNTCRPDRTQNTAGKNAIPDTFSTLRVMTASSGPFFNPKSHDSVIRTLFQPWESWQRHPDTFSTRRVMTASSGHFFNKESHDSVIRTVFQPGESWQRHPDTFSTQRVTIASSGLQQFKRKLKGNVPREILIFLIKLRSCDCVPRNNFCWVTLFPGERPRYSKRMGQIIIFSSKYSQIFV